MPLRPYQIESLQASRERYDAGVQRQLIQLPTGTGKCLAKGTPVLLFDGTIKPVEEIVVGDILMGPDSLPRNVLGLGHGYSNLYKVTPVKGDSYTVNDAHILSLYITPEGYVYPSELRRFVDIPIQTYLKSSATFKHRAKGYRAGVEFTEKTCPIDPFCLGLWLGDGHTNRPSLTTMDEPMKEIWLNLAADFNLSIRTEEQINNASNVYHAVALPKDCGRGKKPNGISNILSTLGVLNNKHVPLPYKANSRTTRIELLSGYLAADGHLSYSGGFEFTSISEVLANDIAFVARSLGLACYVKKTKKRCQTGAIGVYYRGYISGDVSILDPRLTRKQANPRKQKKNVLVTGITVTPSGFGEYFGFELDGDGRFLLGDFTVTHNTAVFANLKPHHVFQNKMLVLVHREELAQQAADKILHWNPTYKVGIEMADRVSSNSDDVVVGSVQTLGIKSSNRLAKFKPNEFDAVVADEAHHAIAPTWQTVFEHFGLLERPSGIGTIHKGLLLGVTATPNRGDGQGLGQVFDEIVYRMSILDAIRDGWLVDVRGFKVRTDTDISGVGTRAGDFSVGQLENAVNVDSRNHLIVQNWMVRGEDRQTIAFCVDIAHAKRLAEVFKLYGVAAEAVWGNDPDRREKLKWHRAGGLKVLTNCGVLTEGYDDWRIGCIIMARPTKSQLLFVQMAGRGTRIQEDIHNLNEARAKGLTIKKEDCILLDVVDNTGKHSLVTLASLFGLGFNTDLKGKTITYAKAEIDAAKEKFPNVDLSQIDTIDEIKSQVERVNLYTVNWNPEVLANSKFQWKKTGENEFTLRLPHNNEQVKIYQDLLDKWNVAGSIKSNKFSMGGLNDLPEAFTQADNLVQSYGKDLLKLLRREEKWHKNKISLVQRNLISKLYKHEPHIMSQLDRLSRGEASVLIDKKFSARATAKAGT